MADSGRMEGPGDNEVRFWLREINLAEKREQHWREEARDVLSIYEADQNTPFNVLYSNTETLLPAVYNATPRPVVSRRYDDPDPLGLVAGMAARRLLEFSLDNPDREYEGFDSLMSSAVLSALLPGRGHVRFRYEAHVKPQGSPKPSKIAVDDPEEATEASAAGEMDTVAGEEEQAPLYECVSGHEVQWDEFLHGYARKWENVPWVAFEHQMTRQDLKANFPGVASKIELIGLEDEDTEAESRKEENNRGSIPTALVYEIWHKARRKVIFVSPSYKEGVLKRVDDPLGLSGFFPMPKPLQFTKKVGRLTPTTLYSFYKTQAKELNRLTIRIARIAEAIKVRGFYDSALKELGNLLDADDNTLLAAQNVAAMGDSPNLERYIWLVPIEKLVTVLSQLIQERHQVKQVIYEITGISDILRGSSVASETATAQKIKNQWGTMRLRRYQQAVQEYVRECLRIIAEIAGEKFSEETWAKVTGMKDVLPTAEKQQAAQMLQQARMQMSFQPPRTPEEQQAAQQQLAPIAMRAAQPSWEEVLGILRDDWGRAYRIDIETNSTVDPESTEDQKNIQELMTALGALVQSLGPVVEKGALPLGAFKAILLAVTRRFRFGPEIEKQLQAIPDQAPKQDDGEQIKAQVAMAQAQADMAQLKAEGQLKQQEMAMKMKEMERDMALKEREHQLRMEELELKMEAARQKAQTDIFVARQKAQAAQETAIVQAATQPKTPPKGNGRARV